MPLPLATQWKLVAAAMMAHADTVMSGEECERLMGLVEGEVGEEGYVDWLAAISDPTQLQQRLAELDPLPAEAHRDVLEEAWHMAVVDGEVHEAESRMLATLGERLGIEPMQLDFWRTAWTTAQSDRAEATIRALTAVLNPVPDAVLQSVLFALPTTHDHRSALEAIAKIPHAKNDVVRLLAALPARMRNDVVVRVADACRQSQTAESALQRLHALAADVGLSPDELAALAPPA